MTNFDQLKLLNKDVFAEWLCFTLQTGAMPLIFNFEPAGYIKDEKYLMVLQIIKDWLEKECKE